MVGVLRNYPCSLPPDFTVDLLVEHGGSFGGAYAWAFYANGGIFARLGFALLAVATGLSASCGWRAA